MKKRIIQIWVLISLLVLSTPACSVNFTLASDSYPERKVRGSGNVISDDRSVSGFDKVDKGGSGNMIIEQGDEEALRVVAEDNLMEYIETRVRDRTLEIRISEDVDMAPTEEIRYYLTVKSLEAISVSGLGDVMVPALETERLSADINSYGGLMIENLNTEWLFVDINSFGSMEIGNLSTEQLSVDMSSMGNLVINGGRASQQDVDISSLGNYEAGELSSDEAEVHISSLGSATVRVSEYLRAEISGKGKVRYHGSPSVELDVSGSGGIEPIDK